MDATALISRVLERTLEKFAQAQAGIAVEPPKDAAPENILIDALAGQLLGLVGVGKPASGQPSNEELAVLFGQLQQQNRRMARAVGACDCWGEIASCPRCGGRGTPGWQLPEREGFETLVRPALNRVSSYRLAAQTGNVRHL